MKEHRLGEAKYRSLNRNVVYHGVDDGLMNAYKKELEDLEIPIDVCRI